MKWRIFRQVYVILTTARRKNLLPSVTASQCNVILKGFALKNLLPSETLYEISHFCSWWRRDSSSAYRPRSEWQEATALTLMVDNVGEEKCPPLSGCRERGRRRKAGEDCLSGASSAAPGGERSGRQKKTDNRRATFLGNFFAAGKKLRNAFILRRYNPEESRNRNRNNKICRYFEWRKNKEKVRFFTLDRNDNYSDWDR